ncbi:DUF3048 domain-containing protein [Thermoanaerobacterium sp. DL9XJH110]|uniref:DUF3048 domain-containing protein n=1 Tax=Thermoanaerobacterium sp. DL9XJH110 TaxID=3386643 RepID=UPI003BB5E589
MMRNNRWILLILTALMLIMPAGCGKKESGVQTGDEKLDGSAPAGVNEKQRETGEPPASMVKNPLTGLDMDAEFENRRPMAVMVENEAGARPQSGLDKADVVYEILAEGGITRFLAIYLGKQCEEIGPVRSARPYFVDYATEYDGIYVHYGASPQAYADLKKLNVDAIDGIYDGVTFWRDKSRSKPHNAYTSTERILKTSEKRGFLKTTRLKVWNFTDESTPSNGQELRSFNLKYFNNYYVGYAYDPSRKVYKRFINGKPHTDRRTGETLLVKNIIVQFADSKVIDEVGRMDIKTTGSGKGYYISEGFFTEIRWQKGSRVGRTKYTLADGTELRINPGNTWIQVMPQWGKFEIEKER